MKVTIDPKEYSHLPELSSYDNNHYLHIKSGVTIKEEFHERNDEYVFYLMIDNFHKGYLGSSPVGMDSEIPFSLMFTS